ncbi:DUF5060 domain-containing protein [Reichenbachiella versicolor]|uniref:DUF5060 domain-containing protein n=1 Tax=Reichenbachiella versicolor TaxID=1821036 RepID=UPI000D6DF930|nr:DUF5060 domain-containing protein [Reichenbachiella versicolor]
MKMRLIFVLSLISPLLSYAADISGELKQWHTITLQFKGPETSEYDTLNPFLDYRLDATFTMGDQSITVAGYYAADGDAAETSARSGNVWEVKFVPNQIGEWNYHISFKKGKRISIAKDGSKGESVFFDGESGKLNISKSDKTGKDLRAKGRLISNGHYPIFEGSREVFIKGGTNSPEDLLAYYEFDGTRQKHKYPSHAKEYEEGDVTWQGGKGKNIIGSLNYLSGKGVNTVYFLTMNVQGDGKNVWPWTEDYERYRFDISKLAQWELVFDHMDKIGLVKHVITQETENENLLDIGHVGIQRKLYYRELVARFGHHLGLIWNMGEENGYAKWTPVAQTNKMRIKMIEYFDSIEPYGNIVAIHTLPGLKDHDFTMTPLLGNKSLDAVSFQIHHLHDAAKVTASWVEKSENKGQPWAVWIDEIGPAKVGSWDDSRPEQQDTVRKYVMWANLMKGGAGYEHYFGYKQKHSDLSSEDWHTKDRLWSMTAVATSFFENLPLQQMKSSDELVSGDHVSCLAKEGDTYVVYMDSFKPVQLDLSSVVGKYAIQWYDPIGGKYLKGSLKTVSGGEKVNLGFSPKGYNKQDWAVLVKKK